MTGYLDLWSGGSRDLKSGQVAECEDVWTDSWLAGEFLSLLPGQNQKIPAFYKIYSSIPFRQ